LLDASLPLIALPVENPAPPVAAHDVALVDVHVSVVGLPELTGFGDAVRVAVGAGAVTVTFTVTEPPSAGDGSSVQFGSNAILKKVDDVIAPDACVRLPGLE
jgi:hypothetical protein